MAPRTIDLATYYSHQAILIAMKARLANGEGLKGVKDIFGAAIMSPSHATRLLVMLTRRRLGDILPPEF